MHIRLTKIFKFHPQHGQHQPTSQGNSPNLSQPNPVAGLESPSCIKTFMAGVPHTTYWICLVWAARAMASHLPKQPRYDQQRWGEIRVGLRLPAAGCWLRFLLYSASTKWSHCMNETHYLNYETYVPRSSRNWKSFDNWSFLLCVLPLKHLAGHGLLS